jgi:hypothetical protein
MLLRNIDTCRPHGLAMSRPSCLVVLEKLGLAATAASQLCPGISNCEVHQTPTVDHASVNSGVCPRCRHYRLTRTDTAFLDFGRL